MEEEEEEEKPRILIELGYDDDGFGFLVLDADLKAYFAFSVGEEELTPLGIVCHTRPHNDMLIPEEHIFRNYSSATLFVDNFMQYRVEKGDIPFIVPIKC